VLGLVGMGGIGTAVASRARAMGLHVLGLRRSPNKPGIADASPQGAHETFGPGQLHEMLERCDAVVIAAPATPETHHMINDAALKAMKKGVVLVNVARGSLVDTAALLDNLDSHHIGAAVLDVFEEEPLPKESPLWNTPNVFISAHSSVSVDRYMDDVFDLFEDNVKRFVAGNNLVNEIDMAALGFE
ncbi:MAG: phosphoglycerate dehydrogenase-like enzyme, partial [Myxococcota bacterium]